MLLLCRQIDVKTAKDKEGKVYECCQEHGMGNSVKIVLVVSKKTLSTENEGK